MLLELNAKGEAIRLGETISPAQLSSVSSDHAPDLGQARPRQLLVHIVLFLLHYQSLALPNSPAVYFAKDALRSARYVSVFIAAVLYLQCFFQSPRMDPTRQWTLGQVGKVLLDATFIPGR